MVFYLAITLILFGDVIASAHRIVSFPPGDIWLGEYSGRVWALPELRHGHLPLWNPYVFSGAPCFTQSQVPFLYPGEWLWMFLPAKTSINLTLALHTFLAGMFTFLWVRENRLSFTASLMAGFLFMLSGPFYLRIPAGDLNAVTVMAWTPLLFLAVDRIMANRIREGALLGTFALGMQLYASQPQFTLFGLIALLGYVLLRLPWTAKSRSESARARLARPIVRLAVCAASCAWAFAIGAVAMVPALIQVGESTRGGAGVPMRFAEIFSMPPENLLTLISPDVMGDMMSQECFGRGAFFEVNVFIGTTAMLLAAFGLFCGKGRERILDTILIVVLLVVAMGGYTPLFSILFRHVPVFRMLRGMGHFGFPVALLLSVQAARGIDVLLTGSLGKRFVAAAAAAAGVLLAAAFAVEASGRDGGHGLWGRFIHTVSVTGGQFVTPTMALSRAFLMQTSRFTAEHLAASGVLLLISAIIIWVGRQKREWLVALAVLALAESFLFATTYRTSFDVRELISPTVEARIKPLVGDNRMEVSYNPNLTVQLGVSNPSGYSSFRLRRYSEFLALTQGQNPDSYDALNLMHLRVASPLLRLLRLKYLLSDPNGPVTVRDLPAPLPHVVLIDRCRVLTGRDRIFAAMKAPSFDPAREIILETPPVPAPMAGPGSPGVARITGGNSDFLEVTATLSRPAILLVTDAYSRYWRVTEGQSTNQYRWDLMPGDYAFRAVPLAAGSHHLRIEYVAPAWRPSEAISGIALVAWVICLLLPVFAPGRGRGLRR